jgi:hypothetical protein
MKRGLLNDSVALFTLDIYRKALHNSHFSLWQREIVRDFEYRHGKRGD